MVRGRRRVDHVQPLERQTNADRAIRRKIQQTQIFILEIRLGGTRFRGSRYQRLNLVQSHISLEHWNIRGYELVFLTKLSFLFLSLFFPLSFFKSFIPIIKVLILSESFQLFAIANNIFNRSLNNTLNNILYVFFFYIYISFHKGNQYVSNPPF